MSDLRDREVRETVLLGSFSLTRLTQPYANVTRNENVPTKPPYIHREGNPMLTEDLLSAQSDLEARATTDGYHRYIKQQEATKENEGPYATLEVSKVVRGSIPLVSKEIDSWLKSNKKGKGEGKSHAAVKPLSQFDPSLLAYIALNGVFSGVIQEHSVAAIQVHMGTVLETEVIAEALKEQRGKEAAKRVQSYVSRQGSRKNREKVFRKLTVDNDIQHEEWPQDFKLKIGEPLVNAVLLALPDLFELNLSAESTNNRKVSIRLTEEGVQLLAQLRESAAWMQPIHRPMVVKPRAWEDFDTGCYYDEKAARNVKLVRTYSKDHRRLVKQAIRNGTMEFVLEALNAIQDTPWTINQPVLDTLLWAYENDIYIHGMPSRSLMELPQKLKDDVWQAMSPIERKGHKLTLSGIRQRNRGTVADSAVMLRDLETAKELSKYERFYLPHNLDFRGRVYPVCHFSNQRADHIKALFQFADGVPFGPSGGEWLSVHIANCGDFERVSKKSFDERLQWVAENEHLILKVAEDPRGTVGFWSQADSPYGFLAGCLEYSRYVSSGRDPAFPGRIPVALDGSNSGLQHYSAALRCREEAELVSLTKGERPADLYQSVADKVLQTVEQEADAGSTVGLLCQQVGIGRSLVKRNVMTFAYSSEQYGFRQQLLTDTMKPLSDEVLTGKRKSHPYDMPREDGSMDGGFAASLYLAQKTWKTVTSVVRRASEGMTFFQRVASVLAHEGLPMVWTTPVGLPVMHKYEQWDVKRVELSLFDRSVPIIEAERHDKLEPEGRGVLRYVRANIRTRPSGKIDKEKAKSAIAPNVIHSMDAAHLMLTVLAAKEQGVTNFALIHDSFGTHAGNTDTFFLTIREAFVDMYENFCPFEEVLEVARGDLSAEAAERLPEAPAKGDFELTEVLEALYAFA